MRNQQRCIQLIGIAACLLSLTSCSIGIEQQVSAPPPTTTAIPALLPSIQPTGIGGPLPPVTAEAATPESAESTAEVISGLSQWAASATASSELDAEHGADQATGEPGDEGCTFDGYQYSVRPGGWASADVDSVETLALNYDIPVIPTSVIIHLEMLPDAVTQVEVVDAAGTHYTVYNDAPFDLDICPYNMQIDVTGVNVPVNQVVITLDQSVFGKPTEINAVELIGLR